MLGKNDKFKFVYAKDEEALKATCDDEDDPDLLFWSEKEPSCGKGEECKNFCVEGGVEWKSSICDQEKHFICEFVPTTTTTTTAAPPPAAPMNQVIGERKRNTNRKLFTISTIDRLF